MALAPLSRKGIKVAGFTGRGTSCFSREDEEPFSVVSAAWRSRIAISRCQLKNDASDNLWSLQNCRTVMPLRRCRCSIFRQYASFSGLRLDILYLAMVRGTS